MCWEDEIIEGPTRQFIQTVFCFQTGLDWRTSSAIQKEEPDIVSEINHWPILWRKIRSQSGIRCTSAKKNQRLGVLIKCLHEKLPVLKTLARRRPDLYENSLCISCEEKEEEDQAHLTKCEKYEEKWNELEQTVSNLAWAVISTEARSQLSKEHLKNIFWGLTREDRIKTRGGLLKGLIQEEVFRKILIF